MYNPFQQKDIENIYRKYLMEIIEKIKSRYHDLGLVASGEFERSLEYLIDNKKLSILGAKHSIFMEEGRRPGRFPPIKVIENWIKIKPGLPLIFKEKPSKYAFIISRNIAKKGIRVPNEHNQGRVASKIIDDFLQNDIDTMLKEVGLMVAGRIQSDLIQVFRIAS